MRLLILLLPTTQWQAATICCCLFPLLPTTALAGCCCHVLQGLQAALRELSLEEGWSTTHLPSANQLKAVDRTDLIRVGH